MRATAAALFCLLALAALPAGATAPAGNPIERENALPGTAGWLLPTAPGRLVEAYASEVSVAPGDVIHLHVSTEPAARYRVVVYRLGWYAGTGARRIGCFPSCGGASAGSAQPMPTPDPATGMVRADWPVTDTVATDANWTSGYYEAEITLLDGPGAGRGTLVPVIVKAAPTAQPAPILVQASVNTWQAYNGWGGKSLYDRGSVNGIAANHVSFDRPYAKPTDFVFAQGELDWEYQLVRYLERNGYDASYTTDVDSDAPDELRRHRLVIVAGHDEYWSWQMRDAFEAARDAGTNLAFLGSDVGEWRIRYEDGGRTIVAYKSRTDPTPDRTQRTTTFRRLGRPECQLVGVQYEGGSSPGDPPFDYHVVDAALDDPWMRGTGFTSGDVVAGVVGYEWDFVHPDCATPGPLTVFLHWPGAFPADAVRYTAPSGARVFSGGSLQLTWALDDWNHPGHADARVQRLVAHALGDLAQQPPPAVTATLRRRAIRIDAVLPPDVRAPTMRVFRLDGARATVVCDGAAAPCTDSTAPGNRPLRYAVVAADGPVASPPATSAEVTLPNRVPVVAFRRTASGLRVVAVDADRDALTVACRVDGRWTPCAGTIVLRPGRHLVWATARDPHGGVATRQAVIR